MSVGGLLVQSGRLGSSDSEEEWGLQLDFTAVAAALDARGICEGPLKKSIAAVFPAAGTAQRELKRVSQSAARVGMEHCCIAA